MGTKGNAEQYHGHVAPSHLLIQYRGFGGEWTAYDWALKYNEADELVRRCQRAHPKAEVRVLPVEVSPTLAKVMPK